MLKHIMVAAMPFGPTFPLQSPHNFGAVGFWLSHSTGVCANIGAFKSQVGRIGCTFHIASQIIGENAECS
jgi:hypothetical protein